MFKKYSSIINKVFFLFCVIIIILLYKYFKPINKVFNLVIISFIIAYIIKPLRNFILSKTKLSKNHTCILIVLIFVVVISLAIYSLFPFILNESKNVESIVNTLDNYVLDIARKFDFQENYLFKVSYAQLNEKINMFLKIFSENILDYLIIFIENIMSFIVIPVMVYYFLVDGDKIFKRVLLIIPIKKREIFKNISKNIDRVLGRYIASQVLLSLIVSVITLIALMILNIRFVVLLSIINGCLNIVPYFGAIIGGIPIILVSLLESPTKGFFALIIIIIIQQIEGNLLAPKITGDSTELHPILIIILLIFGEKLAGISGMVLIIPIVVIIKVIYDDIDYYLY